MQVKVEPFGFMPDGTAVSRFVLATDSGLTVSLIELGAGIQNITMPDQRGNIGSVVLGYDDLEGYLGSSFIQALTVGPVANRINGAEFVIDGVRYWLEKNYQDAHHLHGGKYGLHAQLWRGRIRSLTDRSACVVFEYTRRHMQGGYPGNLRLFVTYELYKNGELRVDYFGVTDMATPVALTNHAYFRLGNTPDVLPCELLINATQYLPVGVGMIPTGKIASVANTPLDFRHVRTIGGQIAQEHPAIRSADGFDVGLYLNTGGSLTPIAATLFAPDTGRKLTLMTTARALQLFTAQNLSGKLGRNGEALVKHGAVCLEPGSFTDAVNQSSLGQDVILRPGKQYRQTSIYKFEALTQ